MIITIDGPTASGKSTVAQALAQTLNFYYLNSGFLYRTLAYYFVHHGIEWKDLTEEQVLYYVSNIVYDYDRKNHHIHIKIDEKPLDILLLKTPEVDTVASKIGENAAIRSVLTDMQRRLVGKHNAIIEGRDSGTVVFKDADYKFFITANDSVRAHRWQEQQEKQGIYKNIDTALRLLQERDERDTKRLIAPLCVPQDAHCIDTSLLTVEHVVQKIMKHIEQHEKK